MKYMKTFESFSINENAGIGSVLSTINKEFSKLSEEEKQRLMDEAKAVANKLGVSVEQLADTEFAVKTMVEEAEAANIPLEESWLGDAWDWMKSKASTYYRTLGRVIGFGGGFASFGAMITAIVVGSYEKTTLALYLRDLTGIGELDRDTQAALFLAGFAGIFISVIAGIYLTDKADNIDRGAAYGTKF